MPSTHDLNKNISLTSLMRLFSDEELLTTHSLVTPIPSIDINTIEELLAAGAGDPRAVYNAVERLADAGNVLGAIQLSKLAGTRHEELLSLAQALGCEGGFLLSIVASEEAIDARSPAL